MISQSLGEERMDWLVVSKEWLFKWEKEIGPLTCKPRATTTKSNPGKTSWWIKDLHGKELQKKL